MSEEPFRVTPEMEADVETEIAALVKQAPHDTPREMFGSPRIKRREVSVRDSGSAPPRPADNTSNDPVNHPAHYTAHPSGVECITVTEWMSFNLGNAVKYIWRAGLKGYQIEDLEKAAWYINREIQRIKKVG